LFCANGSRLTAASVSKIRSVTAVDMVSTPFYGICTYREPGLA
jgi:hypothetical protein